MSERSFVDNELRRRSVSTANGDLGSDGVEQFALKRKIGLFVGISLIVGTMIGSGIFVSPTGVLRYVGGSVGLSLTLWLVCGIVSLLAALCYCELGLAIPESGESNTYLLYAYGKYGRFLAFLQCWSYCFIQRPTANAALAIAGGEYISAPFYPGCSASTSVVKMIAVIIVLLVTFTNCVSVKLCRRLQVVTMLGKVFVLIVIAVAGLVQIAKKNPVMVENFNGAFDVSETVPGTVESVGVAEIGLALYQGLFPYNGWSNLNFVTEEIVNPAVNLPRAVLVSLPTVMLLYMFVNVAYFSALYPPDILNSLSVAVSFADRTFPSWAWIVPVGVAISIYGALNGSFLSNGRIFFVTSRRGFLPEIMSMIHVELYSPSMALVSMTILTCIYIIPGNFQVLTTAFGFASWLFYGLTVLGLLIMRKTRKDLDRPYKVPLVIPIIVVICSAFFVIAPLVGTPDIIFLIVPLFLLFGVFLYFPFVHYGWSVPGMGRLTIFLQQFGNVAPASFLDTAVTKTK